MSTIIVTGSQRSLIAPLLGFFGFGESPEKEAFRKESIDLLSDWHDTFFADLPDDAIKARNPGNNHHQSAHSLIKERSGAGVWGWADCRTTWLLDFWREIVPQDRIFILVHEDPRCLLAELIGNPDVVNIEAVLAQWLAHEREMLNFFRQYPQDCILINGRQALSNPGEFMLACTERLEIDPLLSVTRGEEQPKSFRRLDYILASQAMALYPELDELCAEIEPCLSWADENSPTTRYFGKPDMSDLHAAIHELKEIRQTMLRREEPGMRGEPLAITDGGRGHEVECSEDGHNIDPSDQLRMTEHKLDRITRENNELRADLENKTSQVGQWQRLVERNPDYAFWLQVRNLADESATG